MAIQKVKAFFSEYGIADRVKEFDVSSATVELAAQALGCDPCRIAKTLSFMVQRSDHRPDAATGIQRLFYAADGQLLQQHARN